MKCNPPISAKPAARPNTPAGLDAPIGAAWAAHSDLHAALSGLCRQITTAPDRKLPRNHPLGTRLICPEYASLVQEVKSYPIKEQRLFALCWNLEPGHCLYSTLLPAPEEFCYPYPFSPGEKTQLHTHDYIELMYVVSGEFRQKILDREITFHQGDLCLLDKNCLHQDYLSGQPAIVIFLGIANDMFDEILHENITAQSILLFLKPALLKQKDLQQYLHFRPDSRESPGDSNLSFSHASPVPKAPAGQRSAGTEASAFPDMEECLYRLLSELRQGGVGSSYICRGLLMRIFHILGLRYEVSCSKEQRKTLQWLIFEEITAYIRQHSATVTIRELTEVFHFQEDYFNRLIRSKTGLTYSAYVRQLRLKQAEQLLTDSALTVEEIAEAVGYRNKGYFYKIFIEKYGMTPAKFRKRKECRN